MKMFFFHSFYGIVGQVCLFFLYFFFIYQCTSMYMVKNSEYNTLKWNHAITFFVSKWSVITLLYRLWCYSPQFSHRNIFPESNSAFPTGYYQSTPPSSRGMYADNPNVNVRDVDDDSVGRVIRINRRYNQRFYNTILRVLNPLWYNIGLVGHTTRCKYTLSCVPA